MAETRGGGVAGTSPESERGEFPFAVTIFARLTQSLQVSGNQLLEDLSASDLKRAARITKALGRKRKPTRRELRDF